MDETITPIEARQGIIITTTIITISIDITITALISIICLSSIYYYCYYYYYLYYFFFRPGRDHHPDRGPPGTADTFGVYGQFVLDRSEMVLFSVVCSRRLQWSEPKRGCRHIKVGGIIQDPRGGYFRSVRSVC